MEYEDMTIDELEKENQRLMGEKAKVKAEQVKLNKVMTAKLLVKGAVDQAEKMTEPQKAALLQVLQPKGIESAEVVNK